VSKFLISKDGSGSNNNNINSNNNRNTLREGKLNISTKSAREGS
jgi:hypothetical protein